MDRRARVFLFEEGRVRGEDVAAAADTAAAAAAGLRYNCAFRDCAPPTYYRYSYSTPAAALITPPLSLRYNWSAFAGWGFSWNSFFFLTSGFLLALQRLRSDNPAQVQPLYLFVKVSCWRVSPSSR